MLVVAIRVIASVMRHIIIKSIRTDNIKIKFEQITALCLEIVSHRTFEIALGVFLLISNFLIQSIIVACLKLRILEVYKDDNTFLLS